MPILTTKIYSNLIPLSFNSVTPMNTQKISTLVFVDPTVNEYQSLIDNVRPGVDVIVLDPTRDGITQITKAIVQYFAVGTIHIVSHGEPGRLYLGASELSLATFSRYARQLRGWSRQLTDNAEILIYGCKVAYGTIGNCFVQQLGRVTGAKVAASANLTGHKTLGGDWLLEVATGSIESSLVFSEETIVNYPFVLAPDAIPNLIYTIAGSQIYLTSITTGASSAPVNAGTGATIPNTLAFATNANARDPLSPSQTLYYVGASTNRIGTWNPTTGAATDLAAITGASLSGAVRMAFRDNGQMYVMISNSLYTVSTGTGLGVGNSTAAGTATLVANIANLPTGGGGDMAFDPANPDVLYIAGTTTNNLYKVTFTGSTPSAATLLGAMGGSTPGLAFGPDGNLYSGDATNLYLVNKTNGSRTVIGAIGVTASDMATLPTPSPDLDLSVTITDSNASTTPGNPLTYTITVTNNSALKINGISVVDAFTDPNLSGTPSWSAAMASGVTFPPGANQSGTGNINVKVNLDAGASVTYTVTGLMVSGTGGNTISNSVSVTPPEGITDKPTNPGANTATDTTAIVAPPDTTAPVVTVNTLTTSDGTPQLTGTVDDPTATIMIKVNGTDYIATNNGDGTWTLANDTIAPTLASGNYNVTATATDAASNAGTDSTAGELTVDATAPGVTVNTLTTADGTPALSGTVDDPTATIKVTVNGQTYTATNNGNGTWILANDTITPALASGTYDVTATATDTLGNAGTDTTTSELIVDTTAPVVTVNSLTTNDGTPQLTGAVDDPTATVVVKVNGQSYTAINNGNGTWTLANDTITPTLTSGTYDVTASATDSLGNVGTDATTGELVVDSAGPIVTVNTLTTKDSTPQLTGTVDDPTATVQVTVNGQTYTATNNGDGTWTLPNDTIAPALTSGTYNVTATATDTLSNVGTDSTTGELIVDTTAPVVTVKPLITSDGTPALMGTVDDPTATIAVTVNGQTYTATNNGNGSWSLADDTIAPTLANGTYNVTATVTDALSNVGTDSTTGELTVDTMAPTVTVNSLTTADHTPQLTGTVNDPTATVVVTISGQTYVATNNGNGTWTLADNTITPALVDGTYNIAITATDTVGNTGNDSTTNELVINSASANQAPVTQDGTAIVVPGTATLIQALSATDTDGSIASYKIATLPDAQQGILYLGNPAAGGTIVQVGQVLTATQSNQLFFQASSGFAGAYFTYAGIDNQGLVDSTPATINLGIADNALPIAKDVTFNFDPEAAANITGLSASDADGTIVSYTISTLPPADQGVLFLGDPNAGGTAVVVGQVLAPAQVSQLFFQSASGFTGSQFTYTATDDRGMTDPTPATVTLALSEFADCGCGCELGSRFTGNSRKNALDGTLGGDTLMGRKGNDVLHGLECNDLLQGGLGKDRLFGDEGRDTLFGGLGNDRLLGGADNDSLNGGRGKDILKGGQGDDYLMGKRGNDRLKGNEGNDRLKGGTGRDRLSGGRDNDFLNGGRGKDMLRGGHGDDYLLGRRGDDRLRGGAGQDTLRGGHDNDRLSGFAGNDLLQGGTGKDQLWGGRGNDTLVGGLGQDKLRGNRGNDYLIGRRGNDVLVGGSGDDVLIGGRNKDSLVGGTGNDQFIYRNVKDAGDCIDQFEVNQDVIDLSRIFAQPIYTSSQPFKQYMKLIQDGADAIVQVDVNGKAADGFTSFITLKNTAVENLSADSFTL